MVSAVQVNLPQDLLSQAQQLVQDGWAADFDALVTEALRRYIESHGPGLTEAFLREDVAWGLHGRE